MKTNWMKLLGLALGIAVAAPLWAQDAAPTVDDIVKKTNAVSYYQGTDGRARVKMTIKDKQGSTREREFTILRKNADDKNEAQKFFVYFHRPADVRQMVFMVWKHVGKDDDRWLYLPALDVVRQIAASDERTSFVGSTFFYEDVSGRGLDEDTHELVETTADYYVLKNTPKNPSAVEFDSYTMYIHKGTFIPVKVEFEKGGNVYRVAEALKVEDIQSFKTVTQSRMTDKNAGTETTLDYVKVEYNTGLQDDLFTERFMRKPPQDVLK
ncbi:MAG TPA: outer membrane lipoprotein-sorting protein [Candidatus Hydrogenedentes bacterium]|nr:outer membrane lipoprotein-sorting protein [Candidatus Hydrogenedentota bacterium]HRZ17373.1 outer membrane lipoprotein-sorting protein [Candidatus Hydrogenedentota bacterium]HRZ81209.1 outer membrane lipoprotein-sorting protein [Candidatus Hydrogenedentota bacterium]